MITLNVRAMPDDLYKRMRVRVAEEGLTVRAFVFQAIEDKLNGQDLAVKKAARTDEAPTWGPGGEAAEGGVEFKSVEEVAVMKPKLGYKEAKARKAASRFEKEAPEVQDPQ